MKSHSTIFHAKTRHMFRPRIFVLEFLYWKQQRNFVFRNTYMYPFTPLKSHYKGLNRVRRILPFCTEENSTLNSFAKDLGNLRHCCWRHHLRIQQFTSRRGDFLIPTVSFASIPFSRHTLYSIIPSIAQLKALLIGLARIVQSPKRVYSIQIAAHNPNCFHIGTPPTMYSCDKLDVSEQPFIGISEEK